MPPAAAESAIEPVPGAVVPVPEPGIDFGDPAMLGTELPSELQLDNQGTQVLTRDGVFFGGPVKITGDNGLEVFADTATLDVKTKTVILAGHVRTYQGNLLQHGERAVYHYERKELDTSGMGISMDPILLEAGKFRVEERNGKPVYVGTHAGLTTHDVEDPDFWIRADETKVYPGDRITFRNLKLQAGGVPVLWLPYFAQPLDPELGYHFLPGARSGWGAFLLNRYGTLLGGQRDPVTGENRDAWLLTTWHLDLRTSRGVGTGVDFADIRNKNRDNLPGLSFYYLYDLDPEYSRNGLPREEIDPNRYRVELKHRQPLDIPDGADWHLDANLTLLGDEYYLEDFQPEMFSSDPAPDNMIGIFRRSPYALWSLHTRLNINDFYQTATRLPELAFDQSRRPLFGTPILHEGTTSLAVLGLEAEEPLRTRVIDPLLALPPGSKLEAGYLAQLQGYQRRIAQEIRRLPAGSRQAAELADQLRETGFTRFHTYQDFSLPFTLGGWLHLTPQAGVGYSRYLSVDGPADDDDRMLLRAGMEASIKFSKQVDSLLDRNLGVDGMLHVVQPYVSWSVLSADELDPLYPKVDRLTFTTRPQTLSPERYTATDEMQSWNILRMGTRNQWLTRRDGQAHPWLFLDTYLDAYLEDPEADRTFSNLYNDLHFDPLPWLSVGLETQFPVVDGGSGFNEYATYIKTMLTANAEISLGYRWLDNHPVLPDSNRADLRTYLRLSENWGLGSQHILRFDDGTLELQQYTIHRDFGNWVAGVGLSSRDNTLKEEYGVQFSLSLKDLPSVSLPFGIDMR